jgi:hypothetical protein
MGWNIVTGTIDLGLELLDAIAVVAAWIHGHRTKKAAQAKAATILQRGKRKRPIQPRKVQNLTKKIATRWS